MTRAVEHIELLFHLRVSVIVQLAAHSRVFERRDVDGRLKFSSRHAFEEVNFPRAAIKDAFELRTVAQRPDDGRRLETEDAFEFVEEGDRIVRWAIALVHE